MNRVIYPQRRTYVKYDDNHYLVYINEEVLKDFVPEDAPESKPSTHYAYSGTDEDGGTLITANDATYEKFVSGLIRSRYSADEVEAILLNSVSTDKERKAKALQKLEELNSFRVECKSVITALLA
jgi:hypothetical protein